jgi:hypothetical protein
MEELRQDVATRLERGKRLEQAAAARDAVLEQLLDASEIPLPEGVVAEELAGRRQEIEQQLTNVGMSMEQYLENEKQTVDEFEASSRSASATRWPRSSCWTRSPSRGDRCRAERALRAPVPSGQQSGQNPDEFVKHMVEHNHIPRWSPRSCAARRWRGSSRVHRDRCVGQGRGPEEPPSRTAASVTRGRADRPESPADVVERHRARRRRTATETSDTKD